MRHRDRPRTSSSRSLPTCSAERCSLVRRCPASAASPRCSGCPARPCARRSSAFQPPAWSRCARAMRPRCATSVRHAGLDLLPRLLMRAGELDLSVVRSILEARLHNGPKAAELAAVRRRAGFGRTSRRGGAQPGIRARPGRAATPRADVLGPRRRRSRFHRFPADVQHASRHVRACAAGSCRGDGRGGRPPGGLPGPCRRDRSGRSRAAKKAAIDLLEPATTAMLAAITSLEEQP